MISVNLINRFVFSRQDVIDQLTIPGRVFTNFADEQCPVYAVNEQPESDAPYVIYGWKTFSDVEDYWMLKDEIVYSIWDINVGRLQRLERQLIRYLGQGDVSARAITMWNAGNPALVAIKTCEYLGSTDVYPQEQEGGVVGKNLRFRIKYVDCETDKPLDYS